MVCFTLALGLPKRISRVGVGTGVGVGEATTTGGIAEMGLRVGLGDPFEEDLGDAEAVELGVGSDEATATELGSGDGEDDTVSLFL